MGDAVRRNADFRNERLQPAFPAKEATVSMSCDASAVLVVEDEPLLRLFVSELLVDAGFRVIEAANASEALTILGAGLDVSVLLADVDMPPGINGYELAHEVRRRWPVIEILITSGRRWPAEGDLPAGAAFLAKPCPNEAILAHVHSALDRARKNRSKTADERADGTVVPFRGSACGG
jgi:CheY-like chemotaxis protein